MGNVCLTSIINKLFGSNGSESITCDFEHSNCCSTIIEVLSSSSSSYETPPQEKYVDTKIK